MTKRILFFLLLPVVLFLACSTSEGKGGGGLEPGSTDPEIIEGFLCANVFEGRPVGIDNEFFVDDVIYMWLDTSLTAPTGKWVAEVYLDNKFVRSYGFWLNPKN